MSAGYINLFKETAIGDGLSHKFGEINEKEMNTIYSENTMGRYIQAMICRDDFMVMVEEWLGTLDDERMGLLRSFIFEVDLSDTEGLKDTLYGYGGCLTEGNYFGRKFFEQMAQLVWQIELNRRSAANG